MLVVIYHVVSSEFLKPNCRIYTFKKFVADREPIFCDMFLAVGISLCVCVKFIKWVFHCSDCVSVLSLNELLTHHFDLPQFPNIIISYLHCVYLLLLLSGIGL